MDTSVLRPNLRCCSNKNLTIYWSHPHFAVKTYESATVQLEHPHFRWFSLTHHSNAMRSRLRSRRCCSGRLSGSCQETPSSRALTTCEHPRISSERNSAGGNSKFSRGSILAPETNMGSRDGCKKMCNFACVSARAATSGHPRRSCLPAAASDASQTDRRTA